MNDLKTTKDALLSLDSKVFSSKFIMEGTPYVFNNNIDEYLAWKHEISKKLEIDPRDIVVTGSACLGFSINPNKNFREFDAQSDIDIGIISHHYFETAWNEIRNMQIYNLDYATRNAINDHKQRLIFYGTIGMDKIWHKLSFGAKWNDALTDLKANYSGKLLGDRDWKFRIYMDNKAFRDYQLISIKTAQNVLLENSIEEEI